MRVTDKSIVVVSAAGIPKQEHTVTNLCCYGVEESMVDLHSSLLHKAFMPR